VLTVAEQQAKRRRTRDLPTPRCPGCLWPLRFTTYSLSGQTYPDRWAAVCWNPVCDHVEQVGPREAQ
jgi:hypothetical protein